MSKFKDYKAYQQILRVYDADFAEKMMEDASKCPSFSGNKKSLFYWDCIVERNRIYSTMDRRVFKNS